MYPVIDRQSNVDALKPTKGEQGKILSSSECSLMHSTEHGSKSTLCTEASSSNLSGTWNSSKTSLDASIQIDTDAIAKSKAQLSWGNGCEKEWFYQDSFCQRDFDDWWDASTSDIRIQKDNADACFLNVTKANVKSLTNSVSQSIIMPRETHLLEVPELADGCNSDLVPVEESGGRRMSVIRKQSSARRNRRESRVSLPVSTINHNTDAVDTRRQGEKEELDKKKRTKPLKGVPGKKSIPHARQGNMRRSSSLESIVKDKMQLLKKELAAPTMSRTDSEQQQREIQPFLPAVLQSTCINQSTSRHSKPLKRASSFESLQYHEKSTNCQTQCQSELNLKWGPDSVLWPQQSELSSLTRDAAKSSRSNLQDVHKCQARRTSSFVPVTNLQRTVSAPSQDLGALKAIDSEFFFPKVSSEGSGIVGSASRRPMEPASLVERRTSFLCHGVDNIPHVRTRQQDQQNFRWEANFPEENRPRIPSLRGPSRDTLLRNKSSKTATPRDKVSAGETTTRCRQHASDYSSLRRCLEVRKSTSQTANPRISAEQRMARAEHSSRREKQPRQPPVRPPYSCAA